MASKNTKSGSKMKHQSEDTSVVSENQDEETLIGNKSETKRQHKITLDEAKARVKTLKSVVDGIHAQIKAERAQFAHNPSSIQADIERAQLNWEKIQSELNKFKGFSSKRKDEIDEWKAWYAKLPDAEKSGGLERLQAEIKWRANEIASYEAKISDLISKELEARGIFEMAKLKLAAFQSGVYKLPIEEDPRLKGVITELNNGVDALARLEPKQKEQE